MTSASATFAGDGDTVGAVKALPGPCAIVGPGEAARKADTAAKTEETLFVARKGSAKTNVVGIMNQSFKEEEEVEEEQYGLDDQSEGARLARSVFDSDLVAGKVFQDTVSADDG